MSRQVFDLSDFDSRACDITVRLGENEVLKLTLNKFTLADRIWAEKEFGSLDKWEKTLFPDSMEYSEAAWLEGTLKTVHRLLDEESKEHFKCWEDLATSLECTLEVLTGLQKALLYVLHSSEPLIEKIDDYVKKNLQTLKKVPTQKKANRKTRRKKKTGRK